MLLIANMPDATDYEVQDSLGVKLSGVMAYDTQTQEVEMVLCDLNGHPVFYRDGEDCRPVIIKTFVPGSIAVFKTTGAKVI
jgi:hypothetical protein